MGMADATVRFTRGHIGIRREASGDDTLSFKFQSTSSNVLISRFPMGTFGYDMPFVMLLSKHLKGPSQMGDYP